MGAKTGFPIFARNFVQPAKSALTTATNLHRITINLQKNSTIFLSHAENHAYFIISYYKYTFLTRITSFEQPRFTAFYVKFFLPAPIARIFDALCADNSCQFLYNKDNRDKAIRGAMVFSANAVCRKSSTRNEKIFSFRKSKNADILCVLQVMRQTKRENIPFGERLHPLIGLSAFVSKKDLTNRAACCIMCKAFFFTG